MLLVGLVGFPFDPLKVKLLGDLRTAKVGELWRCFKRKQPHRSCFWSLKGGNVVSGSPPLQLLKGRSSDPCFPFGVSQNDFVLAFPLNKKWFGKTAVGVLRSVSIALSLVLIVWVWVKTKPQGHIILSLGSISRSGNPFWGLPYF